MGKTNQWDFRGKFWILPDSRVIDCSHDEHARYALAAIKGVNIFDEAEVHFYVKLDDLFNTAVCCGTKVVRIRDPRVWMIEKHGWVRVAENKFYGNWKNESTFDAVGKAGAYWEKQTGVKDSSWIELYNPDGSLLVEGRVDKFINFGKLKSIKHSGDS